MPKAKERYFQIVVISDLPGEPRERVVVHCLAEIEAREYLTHLRRRTGDGERAEAWEIPLARLMGDRRRQLE